MLDVRIGIDRTAGRTVALTSYDTLEHARFSRERLSAALAPLQAPRWESEPPEIYEATD